MKAGWAAGAIACLRFFGASLMMRSSSVIGADKNGQVTNMKKLDAEEKEILDAFEAGTLKRAANAKEEIRRHRACDRIRR